MTDRSDMSPLQHDEIEELLGAYALDAVDGDEAEAVELHLRECARCRAEVEEHREVAALLAHSGSVAPDAVWERIAGTIDEAPPAAVMPLARPGRPPSRRGTAWLSTALAAAAAVVAVLGFQVVRLDDRLDRLSPTVAAGGLDQALRGALLDPSATKVRLASTAGGPTADAVVLPDGRGYLIMDGVAGLGADETYQLWGVTPADVVSLGVLGPRPRVVAFSAAGDLKALAVTVERAGGVARSANQPVMAGDVPRSA